MYDLENETEQEDEQIISSPAFRGSRSLSNFHNCEDEDDLSIRKKKYARAYVRKTVTTLEDDHEQWQWFGKSRRRSSKT
jgi:hypothetical protein